MFIRKSYSPVQDILNSTPQGVFETVAYVTTITNQWSDGQRLHVTGTIVMSGVYVANGDILNWQNAIDARQGFIGIMTQNQPDMVFIQGIAGFVYVWTPANNKIKILTGAAAQAALTELAAGALPAGVTGDTITFYAIFKKF